MPLGDAIRGEPTPGEIRARRITAVVLILLVAIAILAIADLGPFQDRTEEDRVRSAVERFVAAREERDFDAVCDLLTDEGRRAIEATSGAQPGTKPPSCAQVLRALAEGQEEGRGGREPEVVYVNVSGNRARADLERSEGITQSVQLELVGGAWRISSFEK